MQAQQRRGKCTRPPRRPQGAHRNISPQGQIRHGRPQLIAGCAAGSPHRPADRYRSDVHLETAFPRSLPGRKSRGENTTRMAEGLSRWAAAVSVIMSL